MGPWTRDKYGKVIDANGQQVSLTGFANWCGYVPPECHKDDDDVFRAVNAHDDLVAALRFVGIELSQRGHVQSAMMDRINTALAKAEGAK